MTADAVVIFGATGDLAMRMLFPSLYFLHADGLLTEGRIVGAARQELGREAFVAQVEAAVRLRADGRFDARAFAGFARRLAYAPVDANAPASFGALAVAMQGAAEPVFYLSTSPSLYGAICAGLASAGLATPQSRVVVEKPIGRDLASCRVINDELAAVFGERRTFRIDHYLGKEAVQNLLALRFANRLFEPIWNAQTLESVHITVAETVGVEGRFGYYDEYGALRDMVQNHLLQLLCLVAMEPPASLEPDSVRNEKVKVLRSLRPVTRRSVGEATLRGQYVGYSREEGGHATDTETFVALRADLDSWRWAGCPFYLRTGKRLATRQSEIVLNFHPVPHSIFAGQELQPNRLVIRLQPEEEISLRVMNKTPSLERGGMNLQPLTLGLSLDRAFGEGDARRRIAYERLLLEAVNGDPTLFVRRDEAEAAWTWVDGIGEAWRRAGMKPVPYPPGGWGPLGELGGGRPEAAEQA